ncbi:vacuolar ATPase assembly protein VMA12-like [Mytilus galloprovincialis]|uniref:vacuolar ATPase assembly protein VMA12-like n=1 Tax=Mytilus galloprovincialis TaxID=29158 RepID=UPI003F7CCA0F
MEPKVKVTERIRELLQDVTEKLDTATTNEIEEIKTYIIKNEKNTEIPFKLVHFAYKNRKPEKCSLYLNELLEDSDLILKEYIPPTRNPELEARIKKLKTQQENKDYKKMTKNVGTFKVHEPGSIGKELKTLNNQMIGVFNFVLTVGGAFVFGYMATKYAFADSGQDSFPLQLMSGLVLGTIVFFADLYFLVKEDMR